MVHLGDICQINGAEIEPVDVITGGSPCQDLSIAGNRKGLAGERSGLFMEQIRIIKEMREADRKRGRSGEFVRCRYAVWENVGGSFSSNKGRDFQAVLTEFVRVAEPDAPDVPMPDKGKWPKSGWLYDELGGWSVAWRIHDAQFWGVPQRRKRIALVADFNGLTAPEILFDPQYRREAERAESNETEPDSGDGSGPEVQIVEQGLSGNFEPSGTPGEGTAQGVEGSVGGTDRGSGSYGGTGQIGGAISFQERAGKPGGARESLSRVSEQEPCQRSITNQCCSVDVYNQTVEKSDISGTVTAEVGVPNHSGPKVMETFPIYGNGQRESHRGDGYGKLGDPSFTLNGTEHHGVAKIDCKNPWDPQSARVYGDDSVWHSLNANESGGQSRDAVLTAAFMGGQGSKAGGLGYHEEVSPSLKSVPSGGNTVPDVVHSVHQNASGEVRESDVSYTVGTNQNASGRNTPLVRSVDCRNGAEYEEVNATLQAKPNGGYSLNTGGRTSNGE